MLIAKVEIEAGQSAGRAMHIRAAFNATVFSEFGSR
jgi:hypothetical protein